MRARSVRLKAPARSERFTSAAATRGLPQAAAATLSSHSVSGSPYRCSGAARRSARTSAGIAGRGKAVPGTSTPARTAVGSASASGVAAVVTSMSRCGTSVARPRAMSSRMRREAGSTRWASSTSSRTGWSQVTSRSRSACTRARGGTSRPGGAGRAAMPRAALKKSPPGSSQGTGAAPFGPAAGRPSLASSARMPSAMRRISVSRLAVSRTSSRCASAPSAITTKASSPGVATASASRRSSEVLPEPGGPCRCRWTPCPARARCQRSRRKGSRSPAPAGGASEGEGEASVGVMAGPERTGIRDPVRNPSGEGTPDA
jgi:hypothetical protein